jgi:hypothetical protein
MTTEHMQVSENDFVEIFSAKTEKDIKSRSGPGSNFQINTIDYTWNHISTTFCL